MKNKWIEIKSEKDLPENNSKCWIFLNNKIELADYYGKHFVVKAEYGMYEYKMIKYYQLIEKPEKPI